LYVVCSRVKFSTKNMQFISANLNLSMFYDFMIVWSQIKPVRLSVQNRSEHFIPRIGTFQMSPWFLRSSFRRGAK
jgi:hypothetical protein